MLPDLRFFRSSTEFGAGSVPGVFSAVNPALTFIATYTATAATVIAS